MSSNSDSDNFPPCTVFFASLGALWGVINACLIGYEVFPREKHGESMFLEFFGWVFVGGVGGFAIDLIIMVFLETSMFRGVQRFALDLFWGRDYHRELQKASDLLSTALEEKDDSKVKGYIGQAQECVLRASGG